MMVQVKYSWPKRWVLGWMLVLLWLGCTSCSLPQVNAEDRLFLPLSVDWLDEYVLPATTYENTPVGGLSAIAYDRQRDRLYVLSDDRGNLAPPRFYTLRLEFASNVSTTNDTRSTRDMDEGMGAIANESTPTSPITIDTVEIESVTLLTTEDGSPYEPGDIDPEGMVLSPQQTLFIASEGDSDARIAPTIDEFDLTTGQRLRRLPIPTKYLPSSQLPPSNQLFVNPSQLRDVPTDPQTSGVQNNRGFEALALSTAGRGEPYRIFAGIEEPLVQDLEITEASYSQPGRILHYVISPDQVVVLSEQVYPIDPLPFGALNNGLVELLVLDQGGHLLSLERSYGLGGVRAKLYQLVFSNANDTSTRPVLPPDLAGVQPMRKRLLLDLHELGIPLDNLEGMTLGPRLPDGSQSLLLISDNNFNSEDQFTQVLLFRLNGLP
ncbi:MAG: esterase-like activity of phytase family protein [Leptolyngbyaceae bacterium]|nr:esterase-like activity of phytase family protein [Leptolyngbyaceae bacterium]